MRRLSPSDLEVILHYHFLPEAHPRVTAPAVRRAIKMFLAAKMLTHSEDLDEDFDGDGDAMENDSKLFTTTERGKVFVEMLCSTPYPMEAWVDPRKPTCPKPKMDDPDDDAFPVETREEAEAREEEEEDDRDLEEEEHVKPSKPSLEDGRAQRLTAFQNYANAVTKSLHSVLSLEYGKDRANDEVNELKKKHLPGILWPFPKDA